MVIVTGKVIEGKVVVDGDPLPEGITVTVLVPDDEPELELSPEQLAELDEAIAQEHRGEGIPVEQFLVELRGRQGGTE